MPGLQDGVRRPDRHGTGRRGRGDRGDRARVVVRGRHRRGQAVPHLDGVQNKLLPLATCLLSNLVTPLVPLDSGLPTLFDRQRQCLLCDTAESVGDL